MARSPCHDGRENDSPKPYGVEFARLLFVGMVLAMIRRQMQTHETDITIKIIRGNKMNTQIKTNAIATDSSNAAIDSLSKATMITMAGVSGLVGLWATACLAAAVVTNGPLGLISGYASALLG
jgi:hypothetical protein